MPYQPSLETCLLRRYSLSRRNGYLRVLLPQFDLPQEVAEFVNRVISTFIPDAYVASITCDKSFIHLKLDTTMLTSSMLTQWPFKKGPSRILSPQCCQGIPPVPTVQHDQRRSHCYPLPYASIKANNLIDGGNQACAVSNFQDLVYADSPKSFLEKELYKHTPPGSKRWRTVTSGPCQTGAEVFQRGNIQIILPAAEHPCINQGERSP